MGNQPLDKRIDTERIEYLGNETSRRVPARLELVFVENPQNFMKDFRVVFDLSVIKEITLGRDPENIVVIPDPTVSRKHAIITVINDEASIKDLNSTNGTYILENGSFRRISEYKFRGETVVRLGYYTIIRVSLE